MLDGIAGRFVALCFAKAIQGVILTKKKKKKAGFRFDFSPEGVYLGRLTFFRTYFFLSFFEFCFQSEKRKEGIEQQVFRFFGNLSRVVD